MRNRSNLLVLLGIAFFVVGAIIVFALTRGDDEDALPPGAQLVTVVVATQDIPANTKASDAIEDGWVKEQQVTAGSLNIGALQSITQLQGGTFIQDFANGSQIISSGIAQSARGYELPEGYEAIAVDLAFPQGVAGYVRTGDRVNIYGAFQEVGADGSPAPQGELAKLFLTNVRVLDVSQTIPANGVQPDPATATNRPGGGGVLFLLAVKTADAERIVYMQQGRALYATLVHEDAPPAGGTTGANAENILSIDPANSAA